MKSGDPSRHCIHYYACVAAFASDLKLTFEFSPYVIKEKGLDTYTIEIDNNGNILLIHFVIVVIYYKNRVSFKKAHYIFIFL